MRGYSKVILIGNLTRDPELRFTPKGMAVCAFGLAINRTWRDEAGQQKEEVTFIDVDAFGKSAEAIAQYVKKGRPLMVEGRLKLHQWDDKQTGQKKTRIGVVLEAFQFIDSGQREAGAGFEGGAAPDASRQQAPRPAARPQQPAPPPTDPDVLPPEEDDVPF